MRFSLASHVGRVRNLNEDRLCVWDVPGRAGHTLLVVADGMGGHQAGEVASTLAVESLRRYLASALAPGRANGGAPEVDLPAVPVNAGGRLPDPAVGGIRARTGNGDLAHVLISGIRAANRKVYRHARGRTDLSGMGTTLTAGLVAGDRLFLAHVGDSRAYLVRDGEIHQLTDDHSLVGELLKTGNLSEAEAMVHPQRHVLTRALGVERRMTVDVIQRRLRSGDLLILATDGLTTLVGADEILAMLTNPVAEFQLLAPRLVALANQRGGLDNVTVIVAAV